MGSLFKAPSIPAPPPPPEPPAQADYERAAALSEEAMAEERKRRKGRGATIVAGALGDQATPQTGKPTLLG
jgi:hypothetical protein